MNNALFTLHSKTTVFKSKVRKAESIIRRALEKMPNPYIAFSGGKDSTVVLHLVRQIAPETRAQYGHEQWVLPETQTFVDSIPNLVQTALPDRHSEWFTVWDSPADVPNGVIYVDRSLYTEFDYAKKLLGFNGCFLGLRSDENSYRYIHLKRRGPIFDCQTHGMVECCPIYDWSVRDVWAYIISRGVVYNSAYDKLSEMGIELERQRVGPLSQWKALGYGQMVLLKRGWPGLFNLFAEKFPAARAYA